MSRLWDAFNTKQWGEIYTDTELWTPIVKEIIKTEGLEDGTVKSTFPGSHAVFAVDNRYIIKIAPPMWRGDLKTETTVYKVLEGLDIPLPHFVTNGVYHDKIEWPYLVITYCKGSAWRDVKHELSRKEACRIMEEFGAVIRSIHSLPAGKLSPNSFEEWDSYIRNQRPKVLEKLDKSDIFTAQGLAGVRRFIESACPLLENSRHCLLHSDLTEDHLLIDERYSLSALIDLADASVGPVEYEWVALWTSIVGRDPEFMKAFFKGYGSTLVIDSTWIDEMTIFTLFHRFGMEIIKDVLKSSSYPTPVGSLTELQNLLFSV